jgi:hypothetical protein
MAIDRDPIFIARLQAIKRSFLATITGGKATSPIDQLMHSAKSLHHVIGIGYGRVSGPGTAPIYGLRVYAFRDSAGNLPSMPSSHLGLPVGLLETGDNYYLNGGGGRISGSGGTGTLGCLATSLDPSDEATYLLSNNHVIAGPGPTQGLPIIDKNIGLQMAELSFWEPLVAVNRMDAAIGALSAEADSRIRGIGTIQPRPLVAYLYEHVMKTGAGSGLTYGSVDDISSTFTLDATGQVFHDQILVKGDSDEDSFSLPEDSGSLVIDEALLRPIGLLFAKLEDPTGLTMGWGVVTPIDRILARFNVSILS